MQNLSKISLANSRPVGMASRYSLCLQAPAAVPTASLSAADTVSRFTERIGRFSSLFTLGFL